MGAECTLSRPCSELADFGSHFFLGHVVNCHLLVEVAIIPLAYFPSTYRLDVGLNYVPLCRGCVY